jgi:DNA primase
VADRRVRLRVLALPNAKDPDELIRSDPTAWPALVRAAVPVIDFVLARLETRHDLATAQGKAAAADEIADVLAGVANPIEQDSYTNEVATRLKVDPEAVRRLLKARRQRGRPPAQSAAPQARVVRGDALDDYLLALLMRLRDLGEEVQTTDIEFILPESRAVYQTLGGQTPPELAPYADRARRQLALIERLSTRELLRRLEETRLRVKRELLQRRINDIRSLGDDGEVRKLVGQMVELAHAIDAIDLQLSSGRESAGSR